MNKVILKQQTKKEKEESKSKKKQEPIKITKDVIRHRLITHFQNHIGESNRTTQEEIFQVVIGINSYMVNSFARFYWFEQIQKMIRELRRKNIAFVIKKKGFYFVLKEQYEADYYKNVCDKSISHMENAKVRADEWVETEKWRDFEEGKVDLTPREKPTKTQEEKIEEDVNTANKKIIRLWKGENENEDKN